ncbi:succinate:quinone oxidoreductase [candidate division GN15 bacterium]|uniref:Succinate:quinone oxidoreductase n=1 Tax=candidate division GN15 bacterium TaxID=2072418 RepID=A0A855XAC3_9BACT|nr:MAG: succinate:quinone oxidoreductase [candidate division GN15 bacterium]
MNNTAVARARSFPLVLVTSSIAKKFVMALTGFVAFGYVVGHMIGNLQIFIGQNQINAYAKALHSMGPLLWLVRGFLIVCIVLHIWLGAQLRIENWVARPDGYARKKSLKTGLPARTMIWTGALIFAFVIYHILQFTVRSTDPRFEELFDTLGRHDVYSMVILGFQNIWISGFYIVAVGLLCFHLSHGIWSMFQSLGWNNKRSERWLQGFAWIFASVMFLGYISIPIAVLGGFLKLPGGVAL